MHLRPITCASWAIPPELDFSSGFLNKSVWWAQTIFTLDRRLNRIIAESEPERASILARVFYSPSFMLSGPALEQNYLECSIFSVNWSPFRWTFRNKSSNKLGDHSRFQNVIMIYANITAPALPLYELDFRHYLTDHPFLYLESLGWKTGWRLLCSEFKSGTYVLAMDSFWKWSTWSCSHTAESASTRLCFTICYSQKHIFKVTGIRPMAPIQNGGPLNGYDSKTLNFWTTKLCLEMIHGLLVSV